MLKINPNPEFTADVEITIPGQEKSGKMSLTFKYKTKSELVEFWDLVKDKTDVEALEEFCVGWDGIDAEFTPENIEKFFNNYPASAREIVTEYQRLLLESRVKN